MAWLIDPAATETPDISAFRDIIRDTPRAETPRFAPPLTLDEEDEAFIDGLIEEFLGQLEETWA